MVKTKLIPKKWDSFLLNKQLSKQLMSYFMTLFSMTMAASLNSFIKKKGWPWIFPVQYKIVFNLTRLVLIPFMIEKKRLSISLKVFHTRYMYIYIYIYIYIYNSRPAICYVWDIRYIMPCSPVSKILNMPLILHTVNQSETQNNHDV